jgi:hypothetical protein
MLELDKKPWRGGGKEKVLLTPVKTHVLDLILPRLFFLIKVTLFSTLSIKLGHLIGVNIIL